MSLRDDFWDARVLSWARERPEVIALQDEHFSFSYAQLKDATDEIASRALSALVPGDRVVVHLPRNAVAALVLVTLLRKGLVGLFVDSKINGHELAKVLELVQPRALVSREATWPSAAAVTLSLEYVFQKTRVHLFAGAQPAASPAGLSWLLQTSGSTGAPKAVMISEKNLVERSKSEVADFRLDGDSRILNVLPFSHDLGLNQLLTSLYVGATLVVKSKSVPGLVDSLEGQTLTGITGTPLLWLDFMKSNTSEKVFGGLKYITVSGGRLPADKLKKLAATFPGARVLKTYGQTETFRTFINESGDDTLGRLVSGVQAELTPEGELLHFGETSMMGYLFDPQLSKERKVTSAAHGVGVRTRDLVDRVGESYRFVGRIDDVIKRFEHRFHLSEVESLVASFAEVSEVVAVTAPANDWRQLYLGFFVRLNPGANVSGDELKVRCEAELTYHKVPDLVGIVSEYPRTSSYKVDRKPLIERLVSEAKKYDTF